MKGDGNDSLARGVAYGRDEARREIRRAIAGPLRTLKRLHGMVPSECELCDAIRAIDRATKRPWR